MYVGGEFCWDIDASIGCNQIGFSRVGLLKTGIYLVLTDNRLLLDDNDLGLCQERHATLTARNETRDNAEENEEQPRRQEDDQPSIAGRPA